VSIEGVAAGASKPTKPLQDRIRKLVATWKASPPFTSGAKTRKPLNFKVLQLKHNEQPNQANRVK
jgi:hypothetical protein